MSARLIGERIAKEASITAAAVRSVWMSSVCVLQCWLLLYDVTLTVFVDQRSRMSVPLGGPIWVCVVVGVVGSVSPWVLTGCV